MITLSSAPAAIKAAATAYIELIVKESDNNVKVCARTVAIILDINPEEYDCERLKKLSSEGTEAI